MLLIFSGIDGSMLLLLLCIFIIVIIIGSTKQQQQRQQQIESLMLKTSFRQSVAVSVFLDNKTGCLVWLFVGLDVWADCLYVSQAEC